MSETYNDIAVSLVLYPNGYGFGMNWALQVEYAGETKTFMLGQDAKVCLRLIGYQPTELKQLVNERMGRPYQLHQPLDLRDEAVCHEIAVVLLECIVEKYWGDGDPYKDLMALDQWDLLVQ